MKHDNGTVEYQGDWSDEAIAKESGAPKRSVERIRQELHGPLFSMKSAHSHSVIVSTDLRIRKAHNDLCHRLETELGLDLSQYFVR